MYVEQIYEFQENPRNGKSREKKNIARGKDPKIKPSMIENRE
jgi:hypothetical protein